MNAKLFVFKNDGTSKEIALKPGQYLVGRGSQATLRIPLPSISREHCLITLDAAELKVKDLGSSNGTYRNHHRITEATLEPGDALGIGDITLVVQIDGRPAQVAPPAPPPPGTPGTPGASGGPGGSSMLMETPPTPPASPKPAKAPTPATAPTTTPTTTPAPMPAAAPTPAAKPAPPPAKAPADPDADTAGDLGTLPQSLSSGESSIFDFDFDLDDEDRPTL